MKKNAIPMIASIASLITTLAFTWFLDDYHRVVELFAMILVIIGSIYLGFAFKDDNKKHWIAEISAASIFILCAAFGLWWNSWLIVAGLIGHGFWDIAHHQVHHITVTDVPAWYIPFCIIYDWLAGGFFAVYLLNASP